MLPNRLQSPGGKDREVVLRVDCLAVSKLPILFSTPLQLLDFCCDITLSILQLPPSPQFLSTPGEIPVDFGAPLPEFGVVDKILDDGGYEEEVGKPLAVSGVVLTVGRSPSMNHLLVHFHLSLVLANLLDCSHLTELYIHTEAWILCKVKMQGQLLEDPNHVFLWQPPAHARAP